MSKPRDSSKPAAPASVPSSRRPANTGPAPDASAAPQKPARTDEVGGPAWPEPTRYGDWERGGRVSDF
jgi:hypothetical protein